MEDATPEDCLGAGQWLVKHEPLADEPTGMSTLARSGALRGTGSVKMCVARQGSESDRLSGRCTSDFSLLRQRQGIIQLYAQVPHSTLQLRVAEQELYGP